MKKMIAALAFGALVIGGATVALGQTDAPTDDSPPVMAAAHERGDILEGVLTDLVSDGTITQSQADVIVSTLEERRQAMWEQRQAAREMTRAALEDGVVTADELTQLGDDHPFNDPDGPFAQYLDDGELTLNEIRQARPAGPAHGHRGGHGLRGPDGFGPGGVDDSGPDA